MSTENPKAVGKRFLKGVFRYWPQIVKTVLCMTAMVGFSLLIPLFNKIGNRQSHYATRPKIALDRLPWRCWFHLCICSTFSNTGPILHLYNKADPT